MEVVINFLDRFWGWFYRRFSRWRELRGIYERAIKQADGEKGLRQAARQILRSDFFANFVQKRPVDISQEFAEFLRRLKESCPQIEETAIVAFLEEVYGLVATEMEGHEVWGKRGDEINEFLRQRRRPVEEPAVERMPQQPTYITHFTSISLPKNFLDREGELKALRAWLNEPEQTVGALVGIGGQGKTYLAEKLAHECSQNGWEVRWMALPKTVDDFLRSIANEMQQSRNPYHAVVGDANQPLEVRIDNAIRFLEGHEKRWLIVLDDFHKVGDDEQWQKIISDLDRKCERTKVLLTARREPDFPLKLPTGAHEIQDVPPLPKAFAQAYLEACGLKVSQQEAEKIWEKCSGNCEAMKLFAQAARRRSVATLLQLPLPDWSKGAMAWCEQLLSDLGEPEREAGKRLALFDEPVERDLLLHIGATQEGLDNLLDWRLAERSPEERYALHDIIREYWRRQTSEEEKKEWHRKAGEWLKGQAERMKEKRAKKVDEWELSEQRVWASYLRRAFWHFVAANDVRQALETAASITEFLDRWGEWSENFKVCQRAYELAKELGDEKLIAVWAHQFAIRHHNLGNYEEAERLYRESLEITERLGDLAGKAATLHELGMLAYDRGNYEEAERLYRESLEIEERLGNLVGKAATLHELGRLAQRRGNYEEAEKFYRESLEIEEQLGNLAGKAKTLHELGMLAQNRGNYEEAERLYRESLRIMEQLGDLTVKAATLHELGRLAQRRGNYEEAERLYRESLEIKERLGNLVGKAVTLWALGVLRKEQQRFDEARELLRQALDIFEKIGDARADDVRKALQELEPS
ncbi:MAG: hypothetical protein SLRJCFUN_001673 [Candidatus Fervidibacter sp.]